MKNETRTILYSKYNPYRKPEFRVSTSVIQEGGMKYVEKEAMCDSAVSHIQTIKDNYDRIKSVYKYIKVVKYENVYLQDGSIDKTRIRIPFIEGISLVKSIKFSKDIEKLQEQLSNIVDKITLFSDDNLEQAFVKKCDIDAIIQNIIVDNEGQMYLYDYEWVMNYPISLDFLRFRILLYFFSYSSEYHKFYNHLSFMKELGYTEDDFYNYLDEENKFQKYVYDSIGGEFFIHKYLKDKFEVEEKFKKLEGVIQDLNRLIDSQFEQIQNQDKIIKNRNNKVHQKQLDNDYLKKLVDYNQIELNSRNNKVNKIKKGIKNPVYGVYLAYIIFINRYYRRSDQYSMEQKDELKRTLMGDYDLWIRRYESTFVNKTPNKNPKINIFIIDGSDKSIDSIVKSTYSNFDITSLDLKSDFADLINNSDGEYFAIIENGAYLRQNALQEIAVAIEENPDMDIFYCDEDCVDSNDIRCIPDFKPDWSPDALMSFDYMGSLCVIRKQAYKDYYTDSSVDNMMWKYDMLLKLSEKTDRIFHINKILCYTNEKNIIDLTMKKNVQEKALIRRGWKGIVELFPDINQSHIIYQVVDNPLVSIIIPSKDHPDVLKHCVDSIIKFTYYRNYEIIVVDNGSCEENKNKYQDLMESITGKYIYEPCEFNFSYMCNLGEKNASGDYLLFLNDDIEIIHGFWLDRMLGHAQLPHIGVVGAKLYYPGSNRIQHMGIILQATGPNHMAARHIDEGNIFNYRNRVEYNFSAVTGACAIVNREKYKEVRGYSEEFAVAYNDIDFSLKLLEKGYYNVVRQDVVLYHHESLSRGNDFSDPNKVVRLVKEGGKLIDKHKYCTSDSYYSRFYSQDGGYEGFDLLNNCFYEKNIKEYKQANIKYKYSIDTEDFLGGIAAIRGWAVKIGDRDKINKNIKLLFRGNEDYICGTSKCFMEELRVHFPWENDVVFCGFYAPKPAGEIPIGKYKISILYDDIEIKTEREIEVLR